MIMGLLNLINDNNSLKQSKEFKTFDKDQCLIKAGIDRVRDSSEFIYNFETKITKEAV